MPDPTLAELRDWLTDQKVEAEQVLATDGFLGTRSPWVRQLAACAALLRLVETQGRDTLRLDWLHIRYGKFRSSMWTADRALGDEDTTVEWLSMVRENWPHQRTTTVRGDWRAAIDKAIQECDDEERKAGEPTALEYLAELAAMSSLPHEEDPVLGGRVSAPGDPK